jgi:hypothetical protein
MKMRNILKFVALASIIGFAAPALASGDKGNSPCGNTTRTPWLSQQTVKAKLTEIGFDVRRLEAQRNCYNVAAIDKLGVLVEMYVDPATAEVLETVHTPSHK